MSERLGHNTGLGMPPDEDPFASITKNNHFKVRREVVKSYFFRRWIPPRIIEETIVVPDQFQLQDGEEMVEGSF